ncbi:MAG: transglutaminaseTgpA domain-containing protein [Actinomycetota bacterium]
MTALAQQPSPAPGPASGELDRAGRVLGSGDRLGAARLRDLPSLVLLVVLSVVATLGFRSVFDEWGFLVPAAIGALGAAMLGLRGRRERAEDAIVSIAVSILAFFALGMLLIDLPPSIDSPGLFLDGLVTGWARFLSTSPPVDLSPQFSVLPYTLAWVGAMLGVELYRMPSAIPGLAALGPVVGMVLAALMVFEAPMVTLAQGCGMVGGALLLGWIQQRRGSIRSSPDVTALPSRQLGATALAVSALALILAGATVLGPRLPFIDSEDRFDLRSFQEPPFEPLQQPSPLGQVKASLVTANSDQVVFRARSEERIARWTLAVMDDYTNEFWAVADERGDPVGEFRPVDRRFPLLPDAESPALRTVVVDIEVANLRTLSDGDHRPVWLVTPGVPVAVDGGSGLDLRYNSSTGTTAVLPDGLNPGTSYRITAAMPVRVDEALLRDRPTGVVDELELQPEARAFTADVVEGRDRGWDQVVAVTSRLREGFYDARDNRPTARPGHSISRLEEFAADPAGPVGFEEQYAALAALMLRSVGVETRVVVGWLIPEDDLTRRWQGGEAEIRAGDASAWIEVRFEEFGWVPFDVTPPRDRQQEEQDPDPPSFNDVATINPPTPPPETESPPIQDQRPVDEDQRDQCERAEDEGLAPPPECIDDGDGGRSTVFYVAGAALLAPVWTLPLAAAVIGLLKRGRSRRRRSAAEPSISIAGAWYEVSDGFQNAGAGVPAGATPGQFVGGLRRTDRITGEQDDELRELVRMVNAAAYHPRPPEQRDAEQSWEHADRILSSVRQATPLLHRWRERLDPRPLLQPDRFRSELTRRAATAGTGADGESSVRTGGRAEEPREGGARG